MKGVITILVWLDLALLTLLSLAIILKGAGVLDIPWQYLSVPLAVLVGANLSLVLALNWLSKGGK